jgi:hypothetical protein
MRHSKIDLTMNIYTDPKLLDVVGAVDSLPALPLGNGGQAAANVLSATETDDLAHSPLTPPLALTIGETRTLQSILDKVASESKKSRSADAVVVTACPVKQENPLTTAVNGLLEVGDIGLEPTTPSLSSWCSNQLS